jgi:hypothetical protein
MKILNYAICGYSSSGSQLCVCGCVCVCVCVYGRIVHAISGSFNLEHRFRTWKNSPFCVILGSCCLETQETEHFKAIFINLKGSAIDLTRIVQTCDKRMENILLKQVVTLPFRYRRKNSFEENLHK